MELRDNSEVCLVVVTGDNGHNEIRVNGYNMGNRDEAITLRGGERVDGCLGSNFFKSFLFLV